MQGLTHHTRKVRLDPRQPPPVHYYADNLLTLVRTVLDRYGDILTAEEQRFGKFVVALSVPGQRLLARLIGRLSGRPEAVIREDRIDYAEIDDVPAALAELAGCGLVDRNPPMPAETIVRLLTRAELGEVFWELPGWRNDTKADQVERIVAANPPCFCRWRVQRFVGWLRMTLMEVVDLYRLLFFGDRHQDLTTFVLRDLGVHRYEAVDLSRRSRQFPDRTTLDRYLEIAAVEEAGRALFPKRAAEAQDAGTEPEDRRHAVAALVERLWDPHDNRMLERRRSRALNRLGRSLEEGRGLRRGARPATPARASRRPGNDACASCTGWATARASSILEPAIRESPWSTLEADFAARFSHAVSAASRTRCGPCADYAGRADRSVRAGSTGRPRAASAGISRTTCRWELFALAYWSWLFRARRRCIRQRFPDRSRGPVLAGFLQFARKTPAPTPLTDP